jgi:hypothetical protein
MVLMAWQLCADFLAWFLKSGGISYRCFGIEDDYTGLSLTLIDMECKEFPIPMACDHKQRFSSAFGLLGVR